MKWIERITAALRTAAHDLISEEDTAEEDHRTALLANAEIRLSVLRDELAQALAREERAGMEWRAAAAQATELDAAVDTALHAEQDTIARAQIEAASRAQAKADELNEHYQACLHVTSKLRTEVQTLQTQIDDVRQQQTQLLERTHSTEAREQINRLHREQRRESATLHAELNTQQVQIAKREDYLAARDEIENSSTHE